MSIAPSKLPIPRLKALRRTLLARISRMQVCDCGDSACSHQQEINRQDPEYQAVKARLEEVNATLAAKQRAALPADNQAHVATHKELSPRIKVGKRRRYLVP